MAPSYALSLSFEGIALFARASLSGGPTHGWYALGEVALDVEDLGGALAVLREEAEAEINAGPMVKLILPNEQIKFLSLPRSQQDAADQAEAALQDATPYALEELVFDWAETDGMVQVAAVARETLAEAEAFAKEHGFVPVSFVAMTPPETFPREPFFGPTALAETLVPAPEVRAEAQPVTVIPGAPPARGPIAVETPVPEQNAEQHPSESEKQEPVEAAAPDLSAEEADVPTAPNEPEIPKIDDPAPAAALSFNSLRADRSTPSETRPQGASPSVMGPVVADASSAAPVPPLDRANPSGPVAGEPAAPNFAQAIKARAQESLEARRPTHPTGPDPFAQAALEPNDDARSVSNVLARAQSGLGRGIGFMSRRSSAPVDTDLPVSDTPALRAAVGGAAGALAAGNKMDEAERMTVFGARRKVQAKVGGKPRFLGLLLTAALLLFLLAVAAWASIFSEDGLARIWFWDEPTAVTETALSDPSTAASADETTSSGPVDPDVLALPDIPSEPSSGSTPEVSVASLSPGLPAIDAPRLIEPDGLARPLGGDALSPEEAEARYAATGIWQASPLAPASLEQRVLGDLVIAALDAGIETTRPSSLSTPQALVTDVSLADPGLPPRADQRFEFDERGFILPTDDGVVSHEGYRIVRGRPDIVPPSRGGLAEPAPTPRLPPEPVLVDEAPAQEAEIAEDNVVPETPATESTAPEIAPPIVVNPELAGSRPLARPVGLTPEVASDAPSPPEPSTEELTTEDPAPPGAALGSVGLAAFTGPRPLARPPEIANQAAEVPEISVPEVSEETSEPASEDDARLALPTSRLAVLQSAAPQLRPRNIAAIARRTDRIEDSAPTTRVAAIAPRTVQPPAPSRQSVARAATQNNAINLRRVNLIGVYGTPSDRRALVRLASGRFQKVKVGDRLDGGRILAISDDQLRYRKSGRNVVLNLPQG